MGVNGNYPHTWFTYIPPQLRGTTQKVPLVFYFHGVNCVPLYGAEQSNWHDIADREKLPNSKLMMPVAFGKLSANNTPSPTQSSG